MFKSQKSKAKPQSDSQQPIPEPACLNNDALKSGQIQWSNQKISTCDLRDQKVSANLEFSDCDFTEFCDFEGACFSGHLTFRRCTFEDFVMFRGARLPDRAVFDTCHFKKGASFASGMSTASGSPVEERELKHINFAGTTFEGYVTFNNREFQRSMNFDKCKFVDPPHFQNTDFHHGTSFDEAEFLPPKFKDQKRLARAEKGYRRLKRLMGELGDIDRHSEFLACELRARVHQKRVSPFEKLMIRLYDFGSDFGRSLIRPILFLIVVSCINFLLLIALTWQAAPPPYAGIADFLLEQSVSPFAALKSGSPPLTAHSGTSPIIPGLIKSVALIQTLTVLTALALFIFSIRRRFSS